MIEPFRIYTVSYIRTHIGTYTDIIANIVKFLKKTIYYPRDAVRE